MSGSLISIRAQGPCVAIQHSETTRYLKEGTLILTFAISAIVLFGGVLGVLALNGVNLGGLNSIFSLIGEKCLYIGLTIGTSILLIDISQIAALTRHYYNKQYTQKQIDLFDLDCVD